MLRNLNTSYVKVPDIILFPNPLSLLDLNTSYVKVPVQLNLLLSCHISNLNTSYVKVPGSFAILSSLRVSSFKYILCKGSRAQEYTTDQESAYLNTSYVKVPGLSWGDSVKEIENLNTSYVKVPGNFKITVAPNILEFKYILCKGSSHISHRLYPFFSYLNTSYVKVPVIHFLIMN